MPHDVDARKSQIDSLLREASWLPGRRVSDQLRSWTQTLSREGFEIHSAAESVLIEYGGLHVGRSVPGVDRACTTMHLNPILVSGERDRLQEYFAELRNRNVYPLGEVDGGHGFLAIAEDGEVFVVGDEVYDRWPSFDAALEGLLLGLQPPAA